MCVHFTEGKKAWLKKKKKQIATVAMVRLQHMVQTVCKKTLCTSEKNTHPPSPTVAKSIEGSCNLLQYKQHQLLFCGAAATSA
jgi:hypothetical protein